MNSIRSLLGEPVNRLRIERLNSSEESLGAHATSMEVLASLPTSTDRMRRGDSGSGTGLARGEDYIPLSDGVFPAPKISAAYFSLLLANRALALVERDDPVVRIGNLDVSIQRGEAQGDVHLIDTGAPRQVLFLGNSAYIVEDGKAVRQLESGESLSLGSTSRVTHDAVAGEYQFSNIGRDFPAGPFSATFNPAQNKLSASLPHLFAPISTTREYIIKAGQPLIVDGELSLDYMSDSERFEYAMNTREGRRILDEEGDHYGTDLALQRLFVARVLFNQGDGDRSLFDEFTPDRASLEGEALAQYDSQIDKVINELRNDGGRTTAGNGQLDASTEFIIASAMVEAFGARPEHIDNVLYDINRGWIVSHDGTGLDENVGGLFSIRNPWFHSERKHFTFRLSSLLFSYSRPQDDYALVAHEAAHALDARRRRRTDGVPTYISSNDALIIRNTWTQLRSEFDASGVLNGLTAYALENNRKEFWADVSALFLSSPFGAQRVEAASAALHDVLNRFYGEPHG